MTRDSPSATFNKANSAIEVYKGSQLRGDNRANTFNISDSDPLTTVRWRRFSIQNRHTCLNPKLLFQLTLCSTRCCTSPIYTHTKKEQDHDDHNPWSNFSHFGHFSYFHLLSNFGSYPTGIYRRGGSGGSNFSVITVRLNETNSYSNPTPVVEKEPLIGWLPCMILFFYFCFYCWLRELSCQHGPTIHVTVNVKIFCSLQSSTNTALLSFLHHAPFNLFEILQY